MIEDRIQELAQVLRRISDAENPEQVAGEAETLLGSISPLQLSLAERELINQGMDPQELRSLCAVHLRVLSDRVNQFRTTLLPDHPLDTPMAEHEMILGALAQLDQLNQAVQQAIELSSEHVAKLERIAALLVDAEPHHAREEDALFPELERRGLTGPPRIMRMEHVELRQRKHALLELAGVASAIPHAEFKARLGELAGYLVFNLREHIFKEDNILYPAAARTVTDSGVWETIKAQSDKIGYCSFTPTSS